MWLYNRKTMNKLLVMWPPRIESIEFRRKVIACKAWSVFSLRSFQATYVYMYVYCTYIVPNKQHTLVKN